MMLFRSLWLVLPLLLSACGGGGSGKGFPVDHCVANCVTGNERLQIEPAQGTLIPGATQQLYALLFDGDHIEREVTGEVVWQSANPAIATVNAQGQVSALAVGTTEISARLGGSLQAAVLIKVIDTAITALQIVPANQLSTPGLSHQYHALALLGSGLQVDVTNSVNWSISNEVVASVSAQGRVSALAVGMTQIQASLQTFTASAHLLVVAPNQAELRITPADLSTPAGTAALFSATLLLGEKELDVSEMVQWQSSNLAVAEFSTPSTPGLASAKVAGSVVISASLSYGGQSLTALAQLQVTQAQVTRVRVTPASLSLPIGARQPLQAIADFSDGSSKDVTYAATWSSADAAVASVTNLTTQKAWVRAVAAGSTRISASYAGFSDAAEVEVTDARLLLLSLNPQSAVVSADVQLSYSLLAHFSDGSRRDVTKAALFSSSEPEVAVIESGGSRAGLATAISAGTTSILASYQSQQVRVSLTVLAQDVSPRSLSLTPVQAELLAGSKLQYRALLTLSNGHQQDVTGSVRWLSSDANIAAVNEQGLASAISSGSAEIGVYLPLLRIPALRAVARLQVVESEVVALHLQPSSKLSVPGLEHQYSAFAQLDSGALVNVSDQVDWSVSNSSVVRIDDNGLLNTLSAGRSDIIAAMGAQRTSAVIQVIDSSSVSLAITPASASAPAGTELQFNALLTVGAQQLDVTDQVIWRSGAPQVADFIQAQEPGLITALRQGVGLIGASFIYKGVALTAAAQMNVSAAVATALRVKPANLTLPVGNSGLLTAIASFSDGSDRDVTGLANWRSANPAVVAVRQRSQHVHNLQALSVGESVVTAHFSGLSAEAQVRVSNATLERLSLSPQDAVLSADIQIRYQLLAHYSDGETLDVTASALFSSSAPAVAIVEASGVDAGLATALSAGSSEIQASYGGMHASANLMVVAEEVAPQALSISPVAAQLLIGSQLQYRAVLTLSNGYQQDVTRSAIWSSGDSGIAAIDAQGLAVGLGVGTSSINARISGLRSEVLVASAKLSVKAAPVTITDFYVEPNQSFTLPGAKVKYRAWAITSDGVRQDVTQSAVWQSSDPALAGISGPGDVRALALGDVQIQADFSYLGQTYSDSAGLSIVAPAITALEIIPGYTKLLLGQQVIYTATAKLAIGLAIDVTDLVSWSSDDPAVASITASGLATSLAGGSTSIGATMSYQGASYTASADLVVEDPEPVLTALMLSPQNTMVFAGHSLGYLCKAVFSDGSIFDVTSSCQWRTAAASIAVIDALTGELTGVAAGDTSIFASFSYGGSSIDASTSVTVLPPAIGISEVQVTPAQAEVIPGGHQEFFATALLSDGRKLDVTSNVVWRSADTAVATVSEKGSARGVTLGESEISASLSLADKTWADSANMIVVLPDVAVEQLRVLPALKLTLPDTSVVYRAELVFVDGTVVDVSALADWSVAEASVAELSNNRGEVRALSPGDTLVEASLSLLGTNYRASAELVVIDYELQIIGLEVQPNPATLLAGGTRQLQAFLILSNGDLLDVTRQGLWQTQDESIAVVDSNGVLSGVSAGTITISKILHIGSASWSASIAAEVIDPASQLAELRVLPSKAEAISGSTVQFTATAIFTSGGSQDVTAEASWTVSKPEVADVTSQSGQVLALAEGNTQVVASYSVGGVTVTDNGKLTVFAPDIEVTGFYLIPARQTTSINGSVSYSAIAEYSNATTQDVTQDAVWLSGEPSVAQLTDVSGQFQGVAIGESTISAHVKLAGKQHTANGTLIVADREPLWIEMSPWYADVEQGQKTRFTALMHYSDGSSEDISQKVSWVSSQPAVAMINNSTDKGVVTGLMVGQSEIRATHSASGLSAAASANVSSATLLSIALEPASASIPVGYEQAFRAIGTYTGGYQIDITNAEQIYWFSNAPQIADVKSNGVVEGVLAGEATITVGLGGVTSTAIVQVTNAAPTRLRLVTDQNLVLAGGFRDYAAIMTFSDNQELDLTKDVSWHAAEQARAQVYNRNLINLRVGRVVGGEAGTTSILASLNGVSASENLEIVSPGDVTELTLYSGATRMTLGQRTQFQVIGRLTDSRGMELSRDVLWESDKSKRTADKQWRTIWSGDCPERGRGEGPGNLAGGNYRGAGHRHPAFAISWTPNYLDWHRLIAVVGLDFSVVRK